MVKKRNLIRTGSALSYRWVWIWLALGLLFAVLLIVNSVHDYFVVARILSVQQVRHQVVERIASVDRALAETASDQSLMKLLLTEMVSASEKPLWIVLRGGDGRAIGQEGVQEREVFSHKKEITHLRNHEPLYAVVPTSQGDAVVEVFPIHVRPRRPPPEQPSSGVHHGPPMLTAEIAMPLRAADTAVLWPIRRNLLVNSSAGVALLLTVVLSAFGFRSYVRGKQLEQQVDLARQVQMNLLPKHLETPDGIQLAVEYEPADEVAGDFYDVFKTQHGSALVIGDVSGKGVPAALLMGVIHGAVRAANWPESKASHEYETAQLNRLLCEQTSENRFATMFWSYCDLASGSLRYVNAGHCRPMLVGVREGKVRLEKLDTGGPVLGILPGAQYIQGCAAIQSGDVLVLYSDGLIEAANSTGEEFGESRLAASVLQAFRETPIQIRDSILMALRNFLGRASLEDDLTCLVARLVSSAKN